MEASALLGRLGAIVGPAHLLTGEEDRRFHATDVFRSGQLPLAVLRPGSVGEVQAIVRVAHETRTPVCVRGGGASYTDGYTPGAPDAITLSMERLNRIVEVDETDRTVTVEAGCTWAALDSALRPGGWRTPFFGPFSGLVSTVGGAVSQHAVSHGTGAFGSAAESLLALEVVTGTGDLLATGSLGSASADPFLRHFGPDLAGLFTGDCGALGVKVRLSFRLQRRQPAAAYASFRYERFEAMHEALMAISAERLDDTHFAIDSEIAAGQMARAARLEAKLDLLKGVLAEAPSLKAGAGALLRMARAGETAVAPFASHHVIEAASEAEGRARLERLRSLARPHGQEIAAAAPTLTRSIPFQPLHSMLGAGGERWVPVHGLLPHSRVAGFRAALLDYFAANEGVMARHGIRSGAMFMAVGPSAFLYEPTLVWPDARSIYHERAMDPDYLARIPSLPANPEAFGEVQRMKAEIAALMDSHGAGHFQIGRFYDYRRGRNPASLALLEAVKRALDPGRILSPGVLGL